MAHAHRESAIPAGISLACMLPASSAGTSGHLDLLVWLEFLKGNRCKNSATPWFVQKRLKTGKTSTIKFASWFQMCWVACNWLLFPPILVHLVETWSVHERVAFCSRIIVCQRLAEILQSPRCYSSFSTLVVSVGECEVAVCPRVSGPRAGGSPIASRPCRVWFSSRCAGRSSATEF